MLGNVPAFIQRRFPVSSSQVESASGVSVPLKEGESGFDENGLAADLGNLNTTDDKVEAFEAIAAQAESNAKTKQAEEDAKKGEFKIVTDETNAGMITKTLMTGKPVIKPNHGFMDLCSAQK